MGTCPKQVSSQGSSPQGLSELSFVFWGGVKAARRERHWKEGNSERVIDVAGGDHSEACFIARLCLTMLMICDFS